MKSELPSNPIDSLASSQDTKLNQEQTKIYSYVMPWDSGLAPNPFFNVCTLALCKPIIRRLAQKGDWVLGISEANDGYRLIYTMLIAATLSFAEYWEDGRYQNKKPDLKSNQQILKVGDNIYESIDEKYQQHHSMHSNPDGSTCLKHYERDLGKNNLNARVLIAEEFYYFGRSKKVLPENLNSFVRGRGHRVESNPQVLTRFRKWLEKQEPGKHDHPQIGNWT
jgi:hypothetical protein